MILAFDDNLGLPDDLAPQLACELASYHELADMLAAFEAGEVQAMFTPAGSLPYLASPPTIVAQATFGPDRTHRLHSVYVVRADAEVPGLEEVAGARLGRVNRYCTTSYWAPMIELVEQRPDAQDHTETIEFVECAGFVDMFASVPDGRSDGAMVWTAVLDANPDLAAETKPVFHSGDLAAPLIVANDTLDADDRRRLDELLADFRSTDDSGFFNGFRTPDVDLVATFEQQMEAARAHFAV